MPNNQSTFFGPYSTWDVAQVEILRGPQGTTQGRNAVGGAIIVNTADPLLGEFSGKVRGSYAELNTYQAAAAINVPVGDSIALRFAADRRASDGYVYNPTRDEDYDKREFTNLRGKVLFAPGSNFTAIYTLNYTDNTGGEDLIDYARFPEERVNLSNDPAREGAESWIHTLELGLDLNDALSLTSISSYYTQDYMRQEDFDFSPADLGNIDRTQDDENFQQEIRLNYDAGGPLRAVIGGFYGRYSSDVADTVQVPTSFVNPALPAGSVFQDRQIANDEENWALFGEVEFDVFERLTLIAGARYDSETRQNSSLASTSAVADNAAFQPFLDQIISRLAPDVLLETDTDYSAFLPKAGLRYRLSDNATIGFTAQKAYRAGGSGISAISQTVYNYDPEHTWTYEGSLRVHTPDRKFSVLHRLVGPDRQQADRSQPAERFHRGERRCLALLRRGTAVRDTPDAESDDLWRARPARHQVHRLRHRRCRIRWQRLPLRAAGDRFRRVRLSPSSGFPTAGRRQPRRRPLL